MSLKFAILGLLEDSPYYGYQIKQKFEHMMGELWPVSYGQLYPTLRKLMENGYVTMETRQGKKAVDKNVYSITEAGQHVFRRWLGKERKRVQHSIKDEFTLSLFFIEKLGKGEIISQLRGKLRDVEEYTKIYRREYNELNGRKPAYRKHLTKKLLLHLEAEKQWLNEVIADYES
jgi:PadR family transcriptional regulator, regulatory protein AphA